MALAVSLLALFVIAAVSIGVAARFVPGARRASSTSVSAGRVMMPTLAGATLCSALVWPSLVQAVCHCLQHGHFHPHLCLRHPHYASAVFLPAGLVAGAWAALALPRLARLLVDAWRTAGWASRLREAPAHVLDSVPFRLVDAPGLGAFTTGLLRPIVAIDAGLWSTLQPEERLAVLHHEDAHRTRLDPLTLFVLRACASLTLLPGAAALVRAWQVRAEEECDRHATDAIGSAESVASALLALERHHRGRPHHAPPLGAGAGGGAFEARVRALLDAERPPRQANLGSDVLAVSLVGFAVATVFMLATGELVHHGAETILGLFAAHL